MRISEGKKVKNMLREYIETQYKTNKAMREELEEQIHTLQEEHQAAEEALKELQKDQDIEKSIFSPRSQLGGTPEKLAEIRTKLTETEKKLEAAGTKQQAVQKEEQEMEQLLAEVLELQRVADGQAVAVKAETDEALKAAPVTVESIDTEKEPATVAEQSEQIEPEKKLEPEVQKENLDHAVNMEEMAERSAEIKEENGEVESRLEKTDTEEAAVSEENDERDKEVASVTAQQDTSAVDAESGATKMAGNTETDAVTPENEEEEEEKPEQTLDMERLNDLLSDVYRKAEFCTAFLYSDKNKCRTLLKEMKKELKKYAEEIAGM